MNPNSASKDSIVANMNERLRSASTVFAQMGTRRAGPRIGTLSNRPIHDFIESDGARWTFDGKNFPGRVLASSDIVHHQAVYSQVTR